jgi:pimeloyl-ACP methyl ester carboxylesterase
VVCRSQDFVPIEQLATYPLSASATAQRWVSELVRSSKRMPSQPITRAMREGVPPATLRAARERASATKTTLLVHGYCSASAPFDSSLFDNGVEFADYSQSRSNDDFARLIGELANAKAATSVVSHSQGGMASLHLHAFYHTTLGSSSNGGRILQSVGTPYQGYPPSHICTRTAYSGDGASWTPACVLRHDVMRAGARWRG